MYTEFITSACDGHHFMEGGDVIPCADGHAFFLGEANVIAALWFHAREDNIFAIFNINDYSAWGLDVVRRCS